MNREHIPLLDHIWPWSTIRRLRRQLRGECDFGSACLWILQQQANQPGYGKFNEVQAVWRFQNRLYFATPDETRVVEATSVLVIHPRTSYKLTGVE